jgi:hypothetical protein
VYQTSCTIAFNTNSNPGVYGKTGSILLKLRFDSDILKNQCEKYAAVRIIKESTALQFGHPILPNTLQVSYRIIDGERNPHVTIAFLKNKKRCLGLQ